MSSLSETITLLANPAPRILDPEDDVNIETAAKISKLTGGINEVVYIRSELRSRAAALDDFDLKYAEGKVSPRSLGKIFQDEEEKSSISDAESKELSDEMSDDLDSDGENYHDDDEDVELSDGDLENFKSSMKKQQMPSDGRSEEEEESAESEASDLENVDLTNKFSNIDVVSEMEKGAAVKAQQELCHRLCEARIKLQKLLIIANKLPQFDSWSVLRKNGGKEMQENINKSSSSVKYLLNNCLDLQAEIMQKNPEITNNENSSNQKTTKQSDEEIPSDTEEDMEETEDQEEKNLQTVKKILKRKLKCDEYGEILTKRYKSLTPYRNSVIQKWDEKTKLSSGRITQKSFLAFEGSALKQIEQILQDETRLIKRTQLKRSLYRVLGKPDNHEVKSKENENTSKQDMLLRDYDTEIFDDDDFYRQLLKDVIESKSVGINPVHLRKQMEMQNVRNKMKKIVDTKASKGRKIRYDVMPKLVNFMKKRETSTLPDDARDILPSSIFGQGYLNSV